MSYLHRLRQLDQDVEQLRGALAALQQRLAGQRPPAAGARPGEIDEYLRAYA